MIKKRLVQLLPHTKKYIALTVFWNWAALLGQIMAIFSIGKLVDAAQAGQCSETLILQTVGLLFAVLILRFLCDEMSARSSFAASSDVKVVLREKIYEKLLRLGATYRDYAATSEVVQMSTEGVEQLEIYFGKYLPQLFYSVLAPVTLFLVLCQVSVKASVVLLICVPLIPLSIVVVQKIAKRLLSKYWGLYTELGDSFLENLQGMTTLKIYQADGRKAVEMDEEAQRFRRITMKVLTMQLNSTSVMDIIAYGGAAAGMIWTGIELQHGNVTLGEGMIIVLLAAEFFIPLRLLGSFFHIAMNGMAASDKIFRLLDQEEPEKGTKSFPENLKEIRFEDVHFGYEKEREILKGISMRFKEGSFTAIVGESGCGKSTVAGILSGRNLGYTGKIEVGNTALSEIAETELLKNVICIRHNSYLFKGTVEENLRMGKPDATKEEMETVLKKVQLYGFLEQQQGLKTELLEQGANFSGGQKQRLCLARALLTDAAVYIFDEASSNIDAESEEQILEVVRTLAETKTVIFISHRLANVTDADCIYFLKDGRIAESGVHEKLLEMKGYYAELFEKQQKLEGGGR